VRTLVDRFRWPVIDGIVWANAFLRYRNAVCDGGFRASTFSEDARDQDASLGSDVSRAWRSYGDVVNTYSEHHHTARRETETGDRRCTVHCHCPCPATADCRRLRTAPNPTDVTVCCSPMSPCPMVNCGLLYFAEEGASGPGGQLAAGQQCSSHSAAQLTVHCSLTRSPQFTARAPHGIGATIGAITARCSLPLSPSPACLLCRLAFSPPTREAPHQ